jgi:putative ABC transport system permease protein
VRANPEEDIHAEIELYLELRARELEEQGMGSEEARRVAHDRFGDARRIERELRRRASRRKTREGTTMMMSSLKQDVAYALRTMRRSPGFSLVAIVTLALALGGNTAIFSVVDAALLQALPFEDHDELVFLNGYHLVDGEIAVRGASFPEFRDWNERSRTMSRMAAVGAFSLSITGDGEAERLQTEMVTEGYFDLLGVRAERGRTFLPEEHGAPNAYPVAVISWGLFDRRFGLDEAAVGSDLVVNDRPMTIVGVMPPGFGGTNLTTDLWVPEAMISLAVGASTLESRGSRFLTVIGRLAPGADIDAAQTEMDVIARALQEDFPRVHEDRFAQVVDFRTGFLGATGGLLWILMGAGAVLLLIASANVANLLLVRSHRRTGEIVLRRALGAASGRIAVQLLTESVMLAVIGGVAGLALAVWALQVLGPMIPAGVLPGYVEPRLSATAFIFSLSVLALVGLLTGLVPAASSARLDIATRIREGARSASAGNPRSVRPQHVFVVAQIALALVLMVGAGLLTRSFRAQLGVDTGSDLSGVMAMSMRLPRSRYDTNETIWAFTAELERQVSAIPGVTSVSLSSDLPFRNGSSGAYIFRLGEGADDRIRFHRHYVTPGFFETLGIEVRQGRALDDGDIDGSLDVIVITQAMAERVYPGESPVGKVMTLRPDGTLAVEIVGVIEDVRFRDVTTSLMADANSPDVFFALRQLPPRSLEVAVRGSVDATSLLAAMRQTVAELDPDLPVYQLQPLAASWEALSATPRFAAFLMTLFSVLAAVLACVGVYGVLAFAVAQRSREIAIRLAIGASRGTVARSVIGDGLRLAAVGLVLGGLTAALGSRVLDSFLYGIEVTDPATFLSMGVGMVTVAVAAAVVPAVRAVRRDPAEALNAD